jgi:RNA polymerase sigma-70 factor (ECF subfamily)
MPPVDALEQSFLAAIEQHRGLLMRLVHLYANDREEQRDLYQEVLFQAWKSWPKFRGESTRSTWLYRVALNTILTAQRLYRAMRDLSEADRAIMALHLDGYSHPEIAELMGIASNHVGVKLFRIKQQLKERLNPSL